MSRWSAPVTGRALLVKWALLSLLLAGCPEKKPTDGKDKGPPGASGGWGSGSDGDDDDTGST